MDVRLKVKDWYFRLSGGMYEHEGITLKPSCQNKFGHPYYEYNSTFDHKYSKMILL